MPKHIITRGLAGICLLAVSYSSYSGTVTQNIQATLDYANSLELLPAFEAVTPSQRDDIVEVGKPVEAENVSTLFYEIQKLFFPEALVELKWCDGCGFTTDYYAKTVHIDFKEVEKVLESSQYKNPEMILRYIFAHEVSHFVHEISAHPPLSEDNGRSINGHLSSYQDHITPVIENLTPEEKQLLYSGETPKVLTDKIAELGESGFKTHAEVDQIAITKLLNQGYKKEDLADVVLYLENSAQENSDHAQTEYDFTNRKNAVEGILNAQGNEQ